MPKELFKKEHEVGLGGVAIGTAFENISDNTAHEIFESAWEAGIRHFDTSPWYGLTRSERRFGDFLCSKKREDFLFSTKIGRVFFQVDKDEIPPVMWKNPLPYEYRHDYTRDGVMRSFENSLKRTGLSSIDIVYVHDLSEDQVGDRYGYFLKQAEKGAFKTLSELRDQGVIKAWGMGVNKIEPILDCLKVADPDVCLSATQYSLLEHEEAIDKLFPEVSKRGVQLVSGAGYNSGYIAGRKRYNYKKSIPLAIEKKFRAMKKIADDYDVDLVHAALQFVLAADPFKAIVPGASTAKQVKDNVKAWKTSIPEDFWKELKEKELIAEKAEVPRKETN